MDCPGRSILFIVSAVYLVPVIIHYAYLEAGCKASADDEDECDGTFIGLHPSSVYTVVAAVGGLVCAILMPLAGAIVDYTDKRKQVAVWTVAIFAVVSLFQAFIFRSTWIAITILQGTVAVGSFMTHQVMTFAYMPELTDDHDVELSRINAVARAWEMVSQLGFILMMTIIGFAMPDLGPVDKARIGQTLAFLIASPILWYAWTFMESRPALHSLPQGGNLATIGFTQVFSTITSLRSKHPMTARFLFGYAFGEAGTGTFVQMGATYLIVQLGMEDTGPFFAAVLVFAIPGSYFSQFVTRRFGYVRSLQMAIWFFIISTLAFSAFAHKPEHQTISYLWGVLFGLAIGWIYPVQRSLYCKIIPGGCEAELMGLYQLCAMIISWLPPLGFTVINEATGSLRAALIVVPVFHAVYSFVLFSVDMNKAVADVAPTLHLRKNARIAGAQEELKAPI